MIYSMTPFRLSLFSLSILCLLEVGSLVRVSVITLPVCRVVNESLDCPIPCWGGMWEVNLLMVGHEGASVHPDMSVIISGTPGNASAHAVFHDAQDENGYNATLLTYRAPCCGYRVKIAAVDEKGNRGHCDFSIRWPSTTVTTSGTTSGHQYRSPLSNSPRITVSLWTTSLLLALAALLL